MQNLMDEDQFWFVSLKELLNRTPGGSKLRRANSTLLPEDQLAETGGDILITLETFFIGENYESDRKDSNDLLARSWTCYGKQPSIERVHFFQKDIPNDPQNPVTDLQAEYVFATRDYDDDRIRIRLQIMEIDKGLDVSSSLGDEIKGIAGQLGAVFPSILPFIGAASRLLVDLERLFSKKQENKAVFDVVLDLSGGPDTGETRLRYGAYVLFKQKVTGIKYKLDNFQLRLTAPGQSNVLFDDYIVIKVAPTFRESDNFDELLSNQQIAAVLSQLDDEDKDNNQKKQEHFEFLKATIANSRMLRELDYYIELKRKAELTEPQKKRLQELGEKLSKYVQ